jgi:3-oxoacyl-[acyl-carrier-protein] synthase-3
VLSILGIGRAYPSDKIDNQLLAELTSGISAGEITKQCSIETRRTTLPASYIRETLNAVNRDAWKTTSKTPTELALEATEEALRRAGLTRQDIGLIIADTSTPRETTPSEGQRLAKKLDLKVPSYDLCSGTGFFPGQADVLNSWKIDRLPEVALCVSTNTPTCAVDYRGGHEMYYFGDAASAVLVSKVRPGKLRIESSFYAASPAHEAFPSLGTDGFLRMNLPLLRKWIDGTTDDMLGRALAESRLNAGDVKFVGTQFSYSDLQALCRKYGIGDANHWHNVTENGYSFGSSAMCVLGDRWDSITGGETIVFAQASAGPGFGFVVLKA